MTCDKFYRELEQHYDLLVKVNESLASKDIQTAKVFSQQLIQRDLGMMVMEADFYGMTDVACLRKLGSIWGKMQATCTEAIEHFSKGNYTGTENVIVAGPLASIRDHSKRALVFIGQQTPNQKIAQETTPKYNLGVRFLPTFLLLGYAVFVEISVYPDDILTPILMLITFPIFILWINRGLKEYDYKFFGNRFANGFWAMNVALVFFILIILSRSASK